MSTPMRYGKAMKASDIKLVRVKEKDGKPYTWFIVHKSGRVSDALHYQNYENNKSTTDVFPKEWLPKYIQKWLDSHIKEMDADNPYIEDGYVFYTYR